MSYKKKSGSCNNFADEATAIKCFDDCKGVINECKVCKGVSNLCFIIVDILNNLDHLSPDKIDESLLPKEQFWTGTLVTQRKGLNGTHDCRRTKRFQKEI